MENKIYKLTEQEFIDLVKSSLNTSEVLFKLGYSTTGNSWGYSQIKQRMQELNIKSKIVKEIIANAGLGKSNQKYVIQYDQDMNELNRFGTISECCEYLMKNNLVKTKILKTCRNTLLRNIDKLWNSYYFKLIET